MPYDRHYFHHGCGDVPYGRTAVWTEFFNGIARRLAKEIAPESVLDVGCAMGLLVEALRDLGVPAYGIDVSRYAIDGVRADVKSHCHVAGVLDDLPPDLPPRFGLVTCIEVLEHLPPQQAGAAVSRLCAWSDDVLFSSSPDDFGEPTHQNVRSAAHWLRLFAAEGFHLDHDFDASFVSPQAFRVRRRPLAAPDIVAGYGRALDERQREVRALREKLAAGRELEKSLRAALESSPDQAPGSPRERALEERSAEQARRIQELERQLQVVTERDADARAALREERAAGHEGQRRLGVLEERLTASRHRQRQLAADLEQTRAQWEMFEEEARRLTDDRDRLRRELDLATQRLEFVLETAGWKLVERFAHSMQRMAPRGSRRQRFYRRGVALVQATLSRGIADVARHGLQTSDLTSAVEPAVAAADGYALWIQRHEPDAAELARQRERAAAWDDRPRISVVTAVLDPPADVLERTIESVLQQSYREWEYVLVDGGCRDAAVGRLLDWAAAQPQVALLRLPQNLGIAGNQNAGFRETAGDFVGFLDHDDVLQPYALYEFARLLRSDRALDLVYSDEDKLDAGGRRVEPFFKPDWSPELLLSMNYITHFTLIRRSLLEELGGFREGYEGSQDYDLLLRATERARMIGHVPWPAYSWRKIAGSAAADRMAKPQAHEAGRLALASAVERRGWDATAEESPVLPLLYRVRFRVPARPRVSILIPTRDRVHLLERCVHSIEEKTAYESYEILILDNESVEPETHEYLAGSPHRRIECAMPFNYAAINNRGAGEARGELLLFLNNDVEVISAGWLEALVEHAQRPEIGAVGARLLFPNGRIQHAGVVMGVGGTANHAFLNHPRKDPGYAAFALAVRNCSAVTGACLMMRASLFRELGGFREELRVAYNDIDLCLRAGAAGYRVVYTPYAELYHYEGASRGRLHPLADEARMRELWSSLLEAGDAYYNPNLSLLHPDFRVDPARGPGRGRVSRGPAAAETERGAHPAADLQTECTR
ncbi:MAG: glycosyltransferase [Gemmatimonadota bacterium]